MRRLAAQPLMVAAGFGVAFGLLAGNLRTDGRFRVSLTQRPNPVIDGRTALFVARTQPQAQCLGVFFKVAHNPTVLNPIVRVAGPLGVATWRLPVRTASHLATFDVSCEPLYGPPFRMKSASVTFRVSHPTTGGRLEPPHGTRPRHRTARTSPCGFSVRRLRP